MLQRFPNLTATGYVRTLSGGSEAFLLEGSDSHLYVVKMAGHASRANVLANEALGVMLGGALGLEVTPGAFISIAHSFWQRHSQISFAVPPAPNRPLSEVHFGSRFFGESSGNRRPTEYLPKSLRFPDANQFGSIGMQVFDWWADQRGRRRALYLDWASVRTLRQVYIGHGQLFGGYDWDVQVPSIHVLDPMFSENDVAYANHWKKTLKEVLPQVLPSAMSAIPSHWYRGDIRGLEQRLCERLNYL